MTHAAVTRHRTHEQTHPAPHRQSAPRGRWLHVSAFAVEHLLVLPAGAIVALLWANLDAESYYRTVYPLAFVVNDVAMALFFGLMTKEVVEATAPGGVLHSWRRLLLPIAAAAGVTLVPALLYVRVAEALGQHMLARTWLIPCAIDVAFGFLIARLIFRRHAVVPFFLVMALAANGLAFIMLGLFFPSRQLHLGYGAATMAAAIGVAGGLRHARVRSFWPYVAGAGTLSWAALYVAGFHPAFALLPVIPFLPHAARDPGFFVDAPPTAHDTLSRFEIWCRYPAQVALFVFAVVNTGIVFRSLEAGMWTLPIAVIVGKPMGLVAGVAVGSAAGLHLSAGIRWRDLIVIGFIAAVGFTLALFFTTAAMAPGQALNETKAGLLVSLAAAAIAIATAKLLRVGRFASHGHARGLAHRPGQ